ncbi:MAG: hypothetical protein WCX79_00965 [Candidatus Paceibacterota bacterium]|jgi:hypothetical protein
MSDTQIPRGIYGTKLGKCQVVGKQKVVKEPGFLYFIKNGKIWAEPMQNNRTGKRHIASEEILSCKNGYINNEGYAVTWEHL